jgi:hypothetical protein
MEGFGVLGLDNGVGMTSVSDDADLPEELDEGGDREFGLLTVRRLRG